MGTRIKVTDGEVLPEAQLLRYSDETLIKTTTGELLFEALLVPGQGESIPANSWSLDIDTADTSWTLRSNSTCTVDVDWGDGNSEQLVLSGSTNTTHTYAAAGQYTVQLVLVSGSFRPYGQYNSWTDLAETDIVALNATGAGWSFGNTLLQAFYGQHSIAAVSSNMDVSQVVSFKYAFREATNLANITFDMPSATDMDGMLVGCTSLVSFNLQNTGSVTKFFYAFYVCNSLQSFSYIDTSAGQDFGYMVAGCSSLQSFPALDMSAGTSFVATWLNCNLDAASIENITQALVANGRSNLTTTINGVSYANWTTQAKADYVELTTNRGWTITTS